MKKFFTAFLRREADALGAFYLQGPGAKAIRKALPPLPLHGARADWKNVLVLAPHPDDEVLGAFLLLNRLRSQGAKITIAYVTDGDAYLAGVGDRRKEAEASARRLNAEAIFLGLRDGGLAHTAGLGEKIASLAAQVQPDALLLPWPGESHPDHRALTRTALSQPYLPATYLFYTTFSPLGPMGAGRVSFLMGSEEPVLDALAGYGASINQESIYSFVVLRRALARAYLNNRAFWEPYLEVPARDLEKMEQALAAWPRIYPALKKTRHWRRFTKELGALGRALAAPVKGEGPDD